MARGSQKIWIRNPSFTKTIVGTSTDTAAVQSLRENSQTNTAVGLTLYVGLPQEFTVVRFLAWVQATVQDSGAGLVTNPNPGLIGVRVSSKEEIEEAAGDAGFRAEIGPVQDPLGDWLLWGPVMAANGAVVEGTTEAVFGKAMFDIRSARRVDGLTEDLAVMLQFPAAALSTTTQSIRASFAALCVIP